MRKASGAFLLVVIATSFAFSQTPNQNEGGSACKLTYAQLPAIRGLKLGMSIEELATLLYSDKSKLQTDLLVQSAQGSPAFGRYSFTASTTGSFSISWKNVSITIPKISTEVFQGIKRIYFDFFDDHIISYTVDYGAGNGDQRAVVWDNVKELVDLFSKTYHLPEPSAWNVKSPDLAILSCTDFKVEIVAAMDESKITRISVKMLKDFSLIIRKRWEDDNRKRREAFKP